MIYTKDTVALSKEDYAENKNNGSKMYIIPSLSNCLNDWFCVLNTEVYIFYELV